ncbi:myozenin-2-like [Hypomesus transpacificus]|uniref:myozenin-2-like n=1 Tax=Hypomesus transpacificus TaxID=137520 RepID=UPI001F083BED|nr:myozenin-2-like [Hypomesus transpacificus]
MSQFSTMTTRERQMQAAAICREIQGSEDAEMDLGKKVSAPKEIMLEELSLSSNRGSRLFKMRQRRSEKYTFESIQNQTNTHINNGVTLQAESQETTENTDGEEHLDVKLPTTPPNTPDQRTQANPDSIAPGYGGPLKDVPPEKFNSTAVPKSYHSPWDQAIISDPALADTLITGMPEPKPQPEAPSYKSFNRVATPFGGFNKTPKPAPVRAPEEESSPAEAFPEYAELLGDAGGSAHLRPTFNRTALGWAGTGAPLLFPTAALDPMFIPESDDL